MKAFAVEFQKIRRRRIWLIIALLVFVQVVWSLWGVSDMDAHDLQQGWRFSLYQFPLLNSIMMPVVAAVVASRLCDVEHKGQSLKSLRTILSAGRIFDSKFLCGAVFMLAATILQVVLICIIGFGKQFTEPIPIRLIGYYLIFTFAINLTIVVFQQVLSLLFKNQMVSLSVGLIGTFIGLFSLFFPQGFQKFLIWGYYGVLMFVRMDWNPETRISNLYWTPVDWSGLIFLAVFFFAIYLVGRLLFIKKEF